MTQIAELYYRFGQAWAAKDVDALMLMTHEDIVFCASVGPEPGRTWSGRTGARQGFETMLAHDDAAAVRIVEFHDGGQWAAATWEMELEPCGSRRPDRVCGVDIIMIRDGLLIRKDAYRKVLGQ